MIETLSIVRSATPATSRVLAPRCLVAILGATLLASEVQAQDVGNASKGLAYAMQACSECHAVRKEQSASPVGKATPFRIIANTPGMTATAITVFLRTPHPTMPNLIVPREDAENLIAYFLSLRDPK